MRDGDRQFYGRRHGKKLRQNRAELLHSLLPRIAVPADAACPAEPAGDAGPAVDPRSFFDRPVRQVWLEIGFGGGEHLAAQAAAHPDVGLIGAEPYINGVATLLSAVAREGLSNIRVLADDVRPLLARLQPASLDRVFILFPDPWPKLRHQRRRIVNAEVLDRLAAAMAPGAELRLATDHMDYARWMMAQLARHPDFAWTAETAADWRLSPADWCATRYERKARSAGARPVFLLFRRRAAA